MMVNRFAAMLIVGVLAAGLRTGDYLRPVPHYLSPTNASVLMAASTTGTDDYLLSRLSNELTVRELPETRLRITQASAGNSEATHRWVDRREIALLNFAPWRVPDRPVWDENPYGSQAWLRVYHSLAWLKAPLGAYESSGDVSHLAETRRLLLDWLKANPIDSPASPRAWYDHAVAHRTDLIVELLARGVLDGATADDGAALLRALHDHGSLLAGYLSEERFIGHNHNLIHALSLYNLGNAVPELVEAARWRLAAIERVGTLLAEMVDVDEGVSLEQAAAYHVLAIRLFSRAADLLMANGEPLPPGMPDVLSRMVESLAVMTSPLGTLPSYGDTRFGSTTQRLLIAEMHERGVGTEVSQFLASRGRDGVPPPELVVYREGGLLVARTEYDLGQAWTSNAQALMDIGSEVRFHGHFDALSLIYTAHGWQFLVDPGGPYAYGEPRRQLFRAAGAHNAVVVDGGQSPAGTVRLVVPDAGPDAVTWAAEQTRAGVVVRRSVAFLRGDAGLLIVDDVMPADAGVHRYDIRYQLAPDTEVGGSGPWTLHPPGGPAMRLEVMSSFPIETVLEGPGTRDDSSWVTTGLRRTEPAPAVHIAAEGGRGWFVTILTLADDDAGRGGDLLDRPIELRLGDMPLTIRLSGGATSVQE